jgi:hypothetical protein
MRLREHCFTVGYTRLVADGPLFHASFPLAEALPQ